MPTKIVQEAKCIKSQNIGTIDAKYLIYNELLMGGWLTQTLWFIKCVCEHESEIEN